MAERKYSTVVPAADEACRALFFLAQAGGEGVPLARVCEGVGFGKSKGFTVLATLVSHGLVLKDPVTKCYSLGPGVLELSHSFLDNASFRKSAGPVLSSLAAETSSTALLGLVSGGRLTIVAKEEAASGIGVTIRIGHRYPLDWGAHGKLLAEGINEGGFGVDLGGMQRGINAVAAPIEGGEGVVVACVLVVGTFTAEESPKVGALAVEGAKKLKNTLRLSGGGERLG